MPIPKIYYARGKDTPGKLFLTELKALQAEYGHIWYHDDGEAYNESVLASCDVLIVSSHTIHKLGKGVYAQILLAESKDIPVFLFDQDDPEMLHWCLEITVRGDNDWKDWAVYDDMCPFGVIQELPAWLDRGKKKKITLDPDNIEIVGDKRLLL